MKSCRTHDQMIKFSVRSPTDLQREYFLKHLSPYYPKSHAHRPGKVLVVHLRLVMSNISDAICRHLEV